MNSIGRNTAFSLVELSIVLVILGLLTGGILAGQSLIRAAELRDITLSASKYRVAVYSFRDKYFQMPGDLNNATAFWGVLAGTGIDATCANTEATATATCNGNGDGIIDTSQISTVNSDERFRFWQHLANAGVIEGKYTGRTDSSTSGSFVLTSGKNVPSIKGGGTYDPFGYFYNMAIVGTVGAFPYAGSVTSGQNQLNFRGPNGTAGPLRPAEQWNIDTKIDDGRPGRGFLVGPQKSWTGSPDCTTSDDPVVATYDLASNDKKCRFNVNL